MHNIMNSYPEMFSRNQPIIPLSSQNKIRRLRVLVAGCGSTGGAFLQGAARLGVRHMTLLDNGCFELNNLNRQFVETSDIGANKAEAHAKKLKALLEGAEIHYDTQGINEENVDACVLGNDFIFDAVDVTTAAGLKAKLLLHERSQAHRKPVASALDLGFKQWIRFFDYRLGIGPLDGQLTAAQNIKNPLKSIVVGLCPLEEMSSEILEELVRLLSEPNANASQIAGTCYALSALTTPLLLRFVEGQFIPKIVSFDIMNCFESQSERFAREKKRLYWISIAKELLDRLD